MKSARSCTYFKMRVSQLLSVSNWFGILIGLKGQGIMLKSRNNLTLVQNLLSMFMLGIIVLVRAHTFKELVARWNFKARIHLSPI